ncbi:MAG: ATP-dependent helicase HrpB [Pseudomonadota bacterium]
MTSSLPIDVVLPEIIEAVATSNRLVLSAAPGAGKTTRIPLALLEANAVADGKILLLEPRRVAARAAAERMASQLGERTGETVGYRIRGESRVSKHTMVEVITEGILTRMLQDDPELPGVSAIIFDEFHERSIHTDLGLALALEAQDALRPDLRLIAMSATLDVAALSKLLGDCPVVTCPGRTFPVETIWLEKPRLSNRHRGSSHNRHGLEHDVGGLCQKALTETDGDVLAFLPGAAEIRRTHAILNAAAPDAEIHLLYGAMPIADQSRVLRPDPDGPRRIILATAIAETSLTVPGVHAVVDSGLARRLETDHATGMSRLATEAVTRAEADQRRGRAGRTGPGTCYRLWTRGEEGALRPFPEPEIRTGELTTLVLELALWGADDPSSLRFLDQPVRAAVNTARALLRDLGAVDEAGRATSHGRRLSRLPLHPRLAHMMTCADERGLGAEGALLAAFLSARPGQTGQAGTTGDLQRDLESALQGSSAAAKAIQNEAKRIRSGRADRVRLASSAGYLAASAYPDRIALRRDGEAPRYLLSNGRGAAMRADHPLASRRLVVVTDLDDGREARIRSAIEVSEAELRALYADRIGWRENAAWSPRSRQVQARRMEMFGALILRNEIWRDAPPHALGAALAEGVRDLGIGALPWPKPAQRLRARLAWLRRNGADDGWPDVSDASLRDSLDDWLTPHLAGLRRIEDISKLDLTALLSALLDWPQRQALDALAPDTFVTAAGTRRPVDYSEAFPQVSVRIQEVYGTRVHPTLGRPALPVTFELLSPADRPVQTTSDLPAFWAGSYTEVRKDLRARYPKHHWPDDPATEKAAIRSTKSGRSADTKR